MLAFVSQVSTLVIGNECGTDAACPGCKDHKELKKWEAKTFDKKNLLKTPFSKNEVGDKKPSFKKEEIRKIIADHKAKAKVLAEKKPSGKKPKPIVKAKKPTNKPPNRPEQKNGKKLRP